MRPLTGIQYLRAVAALAVLIFHLTDRMGTPFLIGQAGVDIFFVISGFIMWAITDRKRPSPQGFMLDRIRRIAPPYWIVTGVMLLGLVLHLYPNLTTTPGYTAASLLFLPAYQPGSSHIWPLLAPGWTLDCEIFFYLVFSASLFLPRRWSLAAMAGVMAALTAAGWILKPQGPAAAVFYTQPILLEFVAGMVLGRLWLDRRVLPLRLAVVLVAASLAWLGALSFTWFEPWRLALCGVPAVALVAGTLAIETHGRLPEVPALRFLGDASYSIYLWHSLAISVAAMAAARFGLGTPGLLVLGLVLALAVSVTAYLGIEKPLMRLLRQRRNPVLAEATRATGP